MRAGIASCVLAGLAACAGSAPDPTDAGEIADASHPADVGESADASADAGSDDAGGSADAAGADPCAVNAVPLIPVSFGDTERYYVRVQIRGSTVALELDTGSNLTFVAQGPAAPAYTPRIGSYQIGCEELPIAGRGLDVAGPSMVEGTPVVGLLGIDYLLEKPSILDVSARSLARYRARPDDLISGHQLASLPFDNVQGLALVPCALDGTAVRLMFDTGGETMWIGQQGRPGDPRQDVTDAQGTVFPVWVGTATLSAADLPERSVRTLRAPRFPYFEDTVRALGGNLHGLLGVEAFAGERLLVDRTRIVVLSSGR
ncbi:MAG: hypothetical protein U1E65_07240 [Myxococcota bacterium]